MPFTYIIDSNSPLMNVIWPFFYPCIEITLVTSTIYCKYKSIEVPKIIFRSLNSVNRSHYKRMCILGGRNQNIVKEYVLELLKYHDKRELFEQLQIWSPPRFPISGTTLESHGCPKGKKMGNVLNELMDIWATGNFEITADDLLKELPTVLKKLEESNDGFVSKKPKIN